MVEDVVLVALRYLVAKVGKHVQMVWMLFAGSVGCSVWKVPSPWSWTS